MTGVEKAILYTLAYSDIFHFPLTKEELWQFLISEEKIDRTTFDQAIKNLSKKIIIRNGFYVLAGHELDIKTRRNNTSELKKKQQIAKHAAYYLSYIPTIKLIGLSGSVAMGKAESNDDIDFFIITKKNKLFITRVLIQSVLEMLNLRRKRQDTVGRDKICVNLLIDETQISWADHAHDVYTAHEVLHMKPLFERDNMFERFITANNWVQQFFPNAFENKETVLGKEWKRNYVGVWAVSTLFTGKPFEKIAAKLQKHHMKRFQTTEIISSTLLAFHPIDYRSKTLQDFHLKLRELGLLTNK